MIAGYKIGRFFLCPDCNAKVDKGAERMEITIEELAAYAQTCHQCGKEVHDTVKGGIVDGDGNWIEMYAIPTDVKIIDFADILDVTEVVPDTDADAPWENCEGMEHDVRRASSFDEAETGKMQGSCYSNSDREQVVIVLKDDGAESYKYYRDGGASKQTAAEKVADQRRGTLEFLTGCYSDGWEAYGVICTIPPTGVDEDSPFYGIESEINESCWGYDSEEYAKTEGKQEIASQAAHQLEKDGHLVINKPDYKKDYLANRRLSLKARVHEQDWRGKTYHKAIYGSPNNRHFASFGEWWEKKVVASIEREARIEALLNLFM